MNRSGLLEIEELSSGKGAACERVLRALPDWFGIESAIAAYVRDVEPLTVLSARHGSTEIGFLSLRAHNAATWEIHVMGVLPDHHRRGVGRALVARAEQLAAGAGAAFLTVKTLSPSRPDRHYDRTRAFYLALGFRPIEEFPELWDAANPCLLLLKPLDPARELRALAERWMRLWGDFDPEAFADLHAPDFVDRSPAGRASGRDAFGRAIEELLAAFPDFTARTEQLFFDVPGDSVAIRWTATGTHRGTFLDVTATGRAIRFAGIEILRARAGRVVERFGEWDEANVRAQLASSNPEPD